MPFELCAECLRRYEEAEADAQVAFLFALDPDSLSGWLSSQGRIDRRLLTMPKQEAGCRYCGRSVHPKTT